MQDRYVGDIGDYAKLTLLRHLVRRTDLRLAIVWCAVDGSREENNDGDIRRYREYSGRHCLKHCDEELFREFSRFCTETERKIENLHPLIPASFFGGQVTSLNRPQWFERAFAQTLGAEVVFFDPDNGLGTGSTGSSPKHIYTQELKLFWERGQSLIVYHHLGRKKGGHTCEAEDVRERLRRSLDKAIVEMVHFKRGTSRLFLLAIQEKHANRLARALTNNVPWLALTHMKAQWAKVRLEMDSRRQVTLQH